MTFTMWSFLHYAFIFSPFVFALILFAFTRKSNEKVKRLTGIVFSVIAVLLLVARNLEIYVGGGYRIQPEIIPLQICHFANFILLFAFLFRNQTLFSVAFCFNLPMAFLSILFANSLENYANIITWRGMAYIFGHMLIVALTLWAFQVKMIKIDKISFRNGIILILILFLISVPINNLFHRLMPDYTSNYFYTFQPEGGTPLDLAFSFGKTTNILGMQVNIIYILTTAAFGSLLYVLFGFFYHLLKKHCWVHQ